MFSTLATHNTLTSQNQQSLAACFNIVYVSFMHHIPQMLEQLTL